MARMEIATRKGTVTSIPDENFDRLRTRFRGPLVAAGDDGYDDARSIWNAMIDRRPALIARCSGTSDVVEAVLFAREHDLVISIKSIGHNIAGRSICDRGLVIDLSSMSGLRVDRSRSTARAQPGLDWGRFDRETQLFGLATPGGIVSTTGITGLTLGGGFGWLTRKHGLTCDSLLSADMVTGDGDVIVASESENPDLFWALRGGGGGFGVVTSMEYRLYPLGPTVLAGMLLYPMDRAAELLRFYRDWTANAPRELGSLALLRIAPPAPFLPADVHGKPVVGIALCYAGDIEAGMRVIEPLKAFGEPLADVIAPKPYVAHQSMLDAAQPSGRQYYWKSEYLPGISDDAIRTIVERAASFSSPLSSVLLMHLGGAATDTPQDATAAGNRDGEYILNIATSWLAPEESTEHVDWTRSFWRAVKPYSTGGTYMNFLTEEEGEDRHREAFGEGYERLGQLRDRYDPDGIFGGTV